MPSREGWTLVRDLFLIACRCHCECHAVSQQQQLGSAIRPARFQPSQVFRVFQTLIEHASKLYLNHGAGQSEPARVPEHVAICGPGAEPCWGSDLPGSAISAHRCAARVWLALCVPKMGGFGALLATRQAARVLIPHNKLKIEVRRRNFSSARHARANRFSLACPRPGKYPAPGSCSPPSLRAGTSQGRSKKAATGQQAGARRAGRETGQEGCWQGRDWGGQGTGHGREHRAAQGTG